MVVVVVVTGVVEMGGVSSDGERLVAYSERERRRRLPAP